MKLVSSKSVVGSLCMGLLTVGLMGCGSATSSTGISQEDYGNLRSASAMFNMYMSAHGGKTPANEQEFRTFLATKQDVFEKTGRTIDEILVSPRNGEPLVFVYGKPPVTGPTGMTYVAYEKTPVDGQRIVIAGRGMYELIDESQFQKLFPGAQ